MREVVGIFPWIEDDALEAMAGEIGARDGLTQPMRFDDIFIELMAMHGEGEAEAAPVA